MSVYHLKYRPQKIDELDSESARKSLLAILSGKESEMPQVFLFAGPKGSGKTSAARILAKSVNCENLKKGEPCGQCGSCKMVGKNGGVDIIEMDAASHRGIDDVRELKDKAYLSPAALKKKVFIVDEVHMMTREAFNAFLKLLEEPPINTIFVLCTTDPEKIPDTVLSRLVRVDFGRGNGDELERAIDRVIGGEGLKVDKKVREMVVARSDGSFRNAQKILTELFLNCGKEIGEEQIAKLTWFWYQGYDENRLARDLMAGEREKILESMEKMAEAGADFNQFRIGLVRYFHDQLIVGSGVELTGVDNLGMKLTDIDRWLQLLIQVGKLEKESVIAQLPLEMAVVEYFKDSNFSPPEKKIEKKAEVKEVKGDGVIKVEEIEKGWAKILLAVRPINYAVEAFLRAAKPVGVVNNTVRLEVFYPFHRDKLIEEKNRKIVEKVFANVFGTELLMECVLGKLKRSSEPIVIPDDKSPPASGDIYDVAKEIFG